jgi:hypothetical protein
MFSFFKPYGSTTVITTPNNDNQNSSPPSSIPDTVVSDLHNRLTALENAVNSAPNHTEQYQALNKQLTELQTLINTLPKNDVTDDMATLIARITSLENTQPFSNEIADIITRLISLENVDLNNFVSQTPYNTQTTVINNRLEALETALNNFLNSSSSSSSSNPPQTQPEEDKEKPQFWKTVMKIPTKYGDLLDFNMDGKITAEDYTKARTLEGIVDFNEIKSYHYLEKADNYQQLFENYEYFLALHLNIQPINIDGLDYLDFDGDEIITGMDKFLCSQLDYNEYEIIKSRYNFLPDNKDDYLRNYDNYFQNMIWKGQMWIDNPNAPTVDWQGKRKSPYDCLLDINNDGVIDIKDSDILHAENDNNWHNDYKHRIPQKYQQYITFDAFKDLYYPWCYLFSAEMKEPPKPQTLEITVKDTYGYENVIKLIDFDNDGVITLYDYREACELTLEQFLNFNDQFQLQQYHKDSYTNYYKDLLKLRIQPN